MQHTSQQGTRSALQVLKASSKKSVPYTRLPTNTTTNNHAVHRWFNFIAGFSPELVHAAIHLETTNTDDNITLLDPFSGCGTAPVTARLRGVAAVGYESHPFFATISEAKANSPAYWEDLEEIHQTIASGISTLTPHCMAQSKSVRAFLGKMFRPEHLQSLFSAQQQLFDNGFSRHPLAILVLSRILDYCCFSATDGIYKAPTSPKNALSPREALDKVLRTLTDDQHEAAIFNGLARIFERSSEEMGELNDNSIDLVVTSPPYLNNFDFAEMTRMYLYFWGIASSWDEITTRVRNRLIVNTTTALRGHKDRQDYYRSTLSDEVRSDADKAVNCLADRRKLKAGKKEYNLLVYPYLSQMQRVLVETHRVLKPHASFHMMVSDAALYGIHLPTPQWLAKIMTECGFRDVQCELVRRRGHRWILNKREGSAQGLGEYYVFGRAS